MFKAELLNELQNRGMTKDIINPKVLDEKLTKGEKICVYAGFDLTADSLHAGHLLPIKTLQMFHKFGHKVIVLFGGATTKIGDPSGRDESRKMQTEEGILQNKIGIMKSISKFIKQDENIEFVDNNDWIGGISYVDFLRDVGFHFSISKMLSMESVKLRLADNGHLSFLEFSYMLLQAFDFYHLYKNYNCVMQIGGSEQWGNIVNGIDLIGKKVQDKSDLFGLTLNLVTRSDGKKMGKSESGAVWLNEDKMLPFDFYQYFRNTQDEDVRKFLLLFSDFSVNEIDEVCKKDINEQKKILAFESVKSCHGEIAAIEAENRARSEFENKAPTQTLIFKHENEGIVDILFNLQLFASKGECKKIIASNGVSLDDIKIDEKFEVKRGEYILKIGKKRIYKLDII